MNFTKSELEMLYQYAAPTKEETLAGLKEIVPVLERKDDLLSKVIAWNTIRKLEKLAEPEYSRFIPAKQRAKQPCLYGYLTAGNRAAFIEKRDHSIRQRLAAAMAGKLYPDKKPPAQERWQTTESKPQQATGNGCLFSPPERR